jgi:hypothetical protein
LFLIPDVENYSACVPLAQGDYVLCEAIVFRTGGKGRGRYAKLRNQRGEHNVILYHRVSKNNIGSGDWDVMNEMMVLALASVLPLD